MSKLGRLSDEQLQRLRELQRVERERRAFERPVDFFPWHKIQRWVLEAGDKIDGDVRVVMIAGGNRAGKSKVAMGVLSTLLRRESPMNKQLLTTDKYTGEIRVKNDREPLTIWVVPPTLEKARQDWVSPQDGYGLKHWCGNLYVEKRDTPDLIIYCRPPGLPVEKVRNANGKLNEELLDKILIKSQDQRLETFESSEVDLVIFDEEVQREKVWNSCLMRVGTTHGFILMPFTPLHGLSWSYKRYWKPLVKDRKAKRNGARRWLYKSTDGGANVMLCQMGSADNPRASAYAREIEMDFSMSDAEKSARLYGEYGYVEGALLPSLAGLDVASPLREHEAYVVDELPKKLKWFLVADPNKSYGAALSATDNDGNMFFVDEHLEEAWPDRMHAEAMKRMKREWAKGHVVYEFADPGSAGAQSIVNMQSFGLNFSAVPKGAGSVSASVKKLRGMTYIDPKHRHPITGELGAPRVYFYRPGLLNKGRKRESELASQISQARQTDNESAAPDTPHKDTRSRLDLFDCARYTAVVAFDMPNESTPDMGLGIQPEDRLPLDKKLFRGNEVSPLDEEFYLPEYTFYDGGAWQ